MIRPRDMIVSVRPCLGHGIDLRYDPMQDHVWDMASTVYPRLRLNEYPVVFQMIQQ
ncbi:hypothetical protein F383_32036 [Gossypium arboreum]|uniref:Uncharacterized protein n=1 Tax=Gossypium arboreum TaxID=29729 RepID=A0A0B0PRC9_GOSAR|nr:hypothetical protein F383_32036 [Gossypium arboreum]